MGLEHEKNMTYEQVRAGFDEACDIIEQLLAENEKYKKLLQRWKESVEPFSVVSDLKTMESWLGRDGKDSGTDQKVLLRSYKKLKRKDRKRYKDTEKALKGE